MFSSRRLGVWLGRLVLAMATALFSMIALRGLLDPVGSATEHQIALGSSAGVTVARVAFGGLPLAFAIILLACLLSERRLLAGLSVLVVVAVVLTAARVLGAVLDGPAPFTMRVLKTEVGLIVASVTALLLERRRRSSPGQESAPVHRTVAHEGS